MAHLNSLTALVTRTFTTSAPTRLRSTALARSATMVAGALIAMAGARVACAENTVACWGSNDSGQCNTPLGLGVITDIGAGETHTVALKSDGTVACWGGNDFGQRNTPAGLASVIQIAGGGYHTLALKSDGTLACWGRSSEGQCNPPAGLGSVTQIAGGGYHTIALKSNGTVACWGWNAYLQCSNTPAGLASVTQIAGGLEHTIALKSNGTVACWGRNDVGQCSAPAGLASVTQIAGGQGYTIALKSDGTVTCWGSNSIGQCNPPAGLASVTGIAAGDSHTIALKSDGTVACWGWNLFGQSNVPAGLEFVTRVAAGKYHTVAILLLPADECVNAATAVLGMNSIDTSLLTPSANPPENGACEFLDWGNSKDGWFVYNAPSNGLLSADFCSSTYDTSVVIYQGSCGALVRVGCDADSCGSSFRSRIIDLPVEAGPVYIRIGGRGGFNYGLANFNLSFERLSPAGWGFNGYGQCNTPLGLGIVTDIAAGKAHTVAIKANGTVAAWGDNNDGQSTVPAGLGVVTRIAAGDYHTVALKVNGSVAAWGNNGSGQCTIPAGLGVVTRIAAGAYHTVAVKADGTIAAWGNNGSGQCTVPPGLGVVGQIAAGDSHTLALKADGAVAAWGNNGNGQCTIPVGLGVVTQIAAGAFHTVALKATGAVAAWGDNNYGQCTVPPGLGVVTHIDAGYYHTVVANADGSFAAWGSNGSGQCAVPAGLGFVTRVAAGGYHTVAMWPELADDCVTAATAVLGMNSINTSLLTPSANPPEDGACEFLDWGNSKDAWFVYDAPSSGLLSADFCSSTYDTSVVVYQGSCGALVRVGCDDDSCGSNFRSRIIDLPVESGPVYIRIGGYLSAVGLATFNLSFDQVADECVSAATAVLGWNSIDTSLLTPSVNPPDDGECEKFYWGNSKDAWFVYNAPSSGLLSADFCASPYDRLVVIYQGSCGALVRVGCGVLWFCGGIIDLPVETGPVYIRIGGYAGNAGLANFNLSFELNCTTDLDGNGSTGASDLATLLSTWGNAGAADFDHNGNVGASDLAILLGAWGECP